MAVPLRPISPTLLAEGRRLYEHTNVAVDDIAALMGIGARTFFTRVRKWGWRRRNLRIPVDGPPPDPEVPPANAQEIASGSMPVSAPIEASPAPGNPAPATPVSLAERIQRAVERELAAIEQIVARFRGGSEHTEEAERAARVLASLARTLQEVVRLDAREDARSEDKHDKHDDRGPADPDEFVRELARRMDAFAAARLGAGVPDAGEPGVP
jgi:hypothetical protein